MPVYTFLCKKHREFDARVSFNIDSAPCPICGKACSYVPKVYAPGIVYKGDGFTKAAKEES